MQLYDAIKSALHEILCATNRTDLINDSISRKEVENESRLIDSVSDRALSYYRRAISYATLQKYNNASSDYNSAFHWIPIHPGIF